MRSSPHPEKQVRKPPQEHLSRQVAPMFPAKRALGGDRLGRHALHRRRDVFLTSLATNDYPLLALGSGKHETSIGE